MCECDSDAFSELVDTTKFKVVRRIAQSGMGYDLEYYMYHNKFGPTNVTLQHYLANLFPDKAQSRYKGENRILTKLE